MQRYEVFYRTAQDFTDPDPGTWMADYAEVAIEENNDPADLAGWYYWYCFPGCLPESSARGPYPTEQDAIDAVEDDLMG